MLSYQIKDKDTILPPVQVNLEIPIYKIKNIQEIKQTLNTAKDQLESIFANPKTRSIWSDLDPFKAERNVVAQLGNTENVSNAWLKAYELISYYELIPKKISNEIGFLHFDNAAFPGSFILACHHYAHTISQQLERTQQHNTKEINYNWKASSLIMQTNEDKEPLEDKYKLWANYRGHWLMSETNNGDVLDEKNQLDFAEKLQRKVDLYTSDLGFDVSSDYANQELLHSVTNIGQIISGLLTLKTGGHFVTKQYTIFEPISISVIYAVASFFEEFYIAKPATSRAANSEIYLVGKGFNGLATKDHPYVRAMFDIIAKYKKEKVYQPMFHIKNCPTKFVEYIIKDVAVVLAERQIKQIKYQLELVDKVQKGKLTIRQYLESIEDELEKWFYDNPIQRINSNTKLKMKKAYS